MTTDPVEPISDERLTEIAAEDAAIAAMPEGYVDSDTRRQR